MKKYAVFILTFAFLLASFIPNFYEASVADILPKDRTLVWGEHIYTYDYNIYLSKIRQGLEGRSTIIDKYDNNPNQQGVLLQMTYLLTGKIFSPLKVSPTIAFHLMRLILSIAWIYVLIWLSIFFLKKPYLYTLGVIFSLLATGFPVFYRFENEWWVGSYMSWWQEMDLMKRISYLPHYLLNYIFISVFTVLLYLIEKKKNPRYFLILCLGIFISIFIHPSAAIVFFFSWFLFHVIKTVWHPDFSLKRILNIGIKTAAILIAILLPLLYIQSVTSVYPWKALIDFEKGYRLSVNIKEYILTLGPLFFTGTAGIILVLIKKEERLLSVATWFLGAWLAIIVFKLFPYQSELRFVQTANHVPMAILSVYFFNHVLNLIRGSNPLKKTFLNLSKIFVYLLIFLIILLGLVQAYFSIKAQDQFIHQRAVAVYPVVPYPPQVMYPINDFWNGIRWLEKNTPRSGVVLSKFTTGNYIPAYAGNFVYFGHNPESPHFDLKAQKVEYFFSGNVPENEALGFLKGEKIDYVFYGPQEKDHNQQDISRYQFLKPVYQSSQVTIFKVNK